MKHSPALIIFKDKPALSQAVAAQFALLAWNAIHKRGRFLVCLSGGTTPAMAYHLLAQSGYRYLPWAKTAFFWGDERCVPPDNPESNFGQANQAMLRHVPVRVENINRIPGELPPDAGAKAYAKLLQQSAEPGLAWPRFDLVLLGLGTDGHVASIFPNSAASYSSNDPAMPVKAEYRGRPAWRITLTAPVFNSARQILFLVVGKDKADALSTALGETNRSADFPARAIQPKSGQVIWLADEAAAKHLG